VYLEQSPIVVVDKLIPSEAGLVYPQSAAQMMKSLAAFSVFALLGASVIALPGFVPKAETGAVIALAKANRLEVRSLAQSCLKQAWPDFSTACLRNRNSGAIVEARLVTARR
jgi:hypothetical protein